MGDEVRKIDAERALRVLQPGGALSLAFKGFEPRSAQQKMMSNIIDAYNQHGIALIEAGTGTGKSIAYLIPALLWAHLNKERTVISTNTINLQEQLIYKDVPTLTKALNIEVKAVLVKGMSNYLCLRKLEDVQQELPLLPTEEAKEINRIEQWKTSTQDGSRSDLPFVPSPSAWERVCAERDTCSHKECPHFQECHFFKARRKVNDAQILIVNHHLLFADLSTRNDNPINSDLGVLPSYSRLILDEAHNIEEVATEYFASRVSQLGIARNLSRLASDKHGKLSLLQHKLYERYRGRPPTHLSALFTRMSIDLPALRNELSLKASNTFEVYSEFVNALTINNSEDALNNESKLRLLPTHKGYPHWRDKILPYTNQLIEVMKKYVQAVFSVEADIKSIKDEQLEESTKNLRLEMLAIANRLLQSSEVIAKFIEDQAQLSTVRWIERQMARHHPNIHLVNAQLDISELLSKSLFSKLPTIILCSATLTTNKEFHFIRKRLGITPDLLPNIKIVENIYASPFNYEQQALFAIPTDIPNPLHPQFTFAAAESIWQAIQSSRGNAFVLFTSYTMLRSCYNQLAQRLEEHRYVALKQGDDNRKALLTRFKNTDRSVLFGTDSFWEGVDVVGDALRCVIIVKLPFKVPTEPIIQARTEAIQAQGGDPFLEYSLPNAIVKFKQGFGRLIRNKRDRGCIVCLDMRLITKNYGKQFLNSLPPCQHVFSDSQNLQKQMSEFYRKTHYLVKEDRSGI